MGSSVGAILARFCRSNSIKDEIAGAALAPNGSFQHPLIARNGAEHCCNSGVKRAASTRTRSPASNRLRGPLETINPIERGTVILARSRDASGCRARKQLRLEILGRRKPLNSEMSASGSKRTCRSQIKCPLWGEERTPSFALSRWARFLPSPMRATEVSEVFPRVTALAPRQ